MGQKLSPLDEKLYFRVDEVLHYIWDPIGISGVPQARDEYHGYTPAVFSLLKMDANIEAIATHLQQIRVDRMGLDKNYKRDLEIAVVLVEWKKAISQVGQ